MKKLFTTLFITAILASCTSYKQVGDLNMISKRNVSMENEYTLVKSYAGSDSKKDIQKEAKKIKNTTIDGAVDYTVKNVAGGEFIMNARIYLVDGNYFIVRGDVWGLKGQDLQHKGWQVGNKVQWKTVTGLKKGVIVDLKNIDEATVKEEGTEALKVIKYDKLLKEN